MTPAPRGSDETRALYGVEALDRALPTTEKEWEPFWHRVDDPDGWVVSVYGSKLAGYIADRLEEQGLLISKADPDTVSVPRAGAVQRLRELIHESECRRNPRCSSPDSHRHEGWGDPPFQATAEAWFAALAALSSSEPEPEEPPYGS